MIVKKLLSAIAHMHDRGIAHRDLKPENVLYNSYEENAEIKLVDFGFAKNINMDGGLNTPLGTLGYKGKECAGSSLVHSPFLTSFSSQLLS
jgi:serine/threonine protein kinase